MQHLGFKIFEEMQKATTEVEVAWDEAFQNLDLIPLFFFPSLEGKEKKNFT